MPTRKTPLDPARIRRFLRDHAESIDRDPLTNSVFSFALQLFQDLEAGRTDLSSVAETVDGLHFDLLKDRADQFRSQHTEIGKPKDAFAGVSAKLAALAKSDPERFRHTVTRHAGGIVFTAHPTFALSQDLRRAFAAYASKPGKIELATLKTVASDPQPDWPDQITLTHEHEEAQDAITNAQDAAGHYAGIMVDAARKSLDDWRSLRPVLPTLASWVGYDLDGRTDIHWSQSITLRLREKAAQLAYYRGRLSNFAKFETLKALEERLAAAQAHTEAAAEKFGQDLSDPNVLSQAANFLTAASDDKITDAVTLSDPLTTLIKDAETPDETAAALMILRAEIDALQLGTARIHLRVNAAQVRTVLQRDLDLETEDSELGRLALSKLSKMAVKTEVRPVNFADLFLEQSTARRQFMMCAQILKHIDAGSPIRFLIAESENPATVMGALHLARQYGVDHALDISPLFETPEALETGGRFVERLLEEDAFRDYIRTRGYLSIQLGFSDSGRFIGQVAGNMAIERIHSLIGRALGDVLPGTGLLVFNTHGESIGRGAYPGSFQQRHNHLLTPWTRSELLARNIQPIHEVSFQGGDGFLHFATPELSHATYAAFCEHILSEPTSIEDDAFYTQTDFVWDAYRALRSWHETLFVDRDYEEMLGGFTSGFLVKAGSRPVKRAGGPSGPSAIRAISHNAMLQQLGVPLNSACGIGSAMPREKERMRDIINASPRLHALIMLATRARMLTSLPVLRGYASVFDPHVWLAVSRHGDISQAGPMRRIAEALRENQTAASLQKIANRLSVDLVEFDGLIAFLDETPSVESRHESRLDFHALHAIRQALMLYAFSLTGRLSDLSARHDTSRTDIIALVLTMQIEQAADLLEEIYPPSHGEADLFQHIDEPGYETGARSETGYDRLHQELIAPLRQCGTLISRLSVATSHAFNAWG
ncbi:phosphoenolpyruvate carboxylase [Henriciella barbarensis]|uniref:Phosphoenolpyruvate carboxylase n=1 Tax=Henriciella barbarensis TaxID=86342 RepID=A0A399QWZ1_9PROT|nr:phosphoenolpyruvate carboxylase [Henriciella barbarensis]RIJ23313.1 phosphoenolpyruvate carboxylase [Henriciella barbarensis]